MADKNDERNEIIKEFNDLVNMTPKQLGKWLDTEESKSVGQKSSGGGESSPPDRPLSV